MDFYREQSPWQIAGQSAEKLRSGPLIRQVIGDRDETLRFNRDFHQHLDSLKVPHTYRQIPGVPHNPNLLLDALGEDNWTFYRKALGMLTPGKAE
jgi:enterochelin esterase-like enzyme